METCADEDGLLPYTDDEIEEFEKAIVDNADLRKLDLIGEGLTSVVFRGTYRDVEVAIKEMHDLNTMGANDMLNLERELNILRHVSHDHLVSFIGVTQHKDRVRIVTEYCRGGDAFDLLHNSGLQLELDQKTKMAKDVASAMEYLHSLDPPIIHRDLKSLNLLLTAPVRRLGDMPFVKVADFGVARMMDEINKMTHNRGTYHWMAPEVLDMEENYDGKVDVYSYSMVLYEIICQAMPFADIKPELVCLHVAQGRRPDLDKVPPGTPEYLKNMMIQSWADSATDRPSFLDISARLAAAA